MADHRLRGVVESVALLVAVAIGVAGLEDLLMRIARRHDDRAPMHEAGVKTQRRRLLPAMRGRGRGHRADRLVRQLALLPERAQRVDEGAQLRGRRAIARGGREQIGIGPDHVVMADGRNIRGLLGMRGPGVLAGHDLFRRGLGDFQKPHLGAGCLRGLGGDLGHLMVGAVGRVIDDRKFHCGHDASPLQVCPAGN
jgi:hypothetical protein